MLLICPNCGAQYAVADDVIPAGGRDVQCSNCAHTWFEMPGASAEDTEAPRKPRPAPAAPQADDDPDLAPAPRAPANRRTVDPGVADILREEAARETAKRREEAPAGIESQSDLGLQDPAPDRRQPEPTAESRVVTKTPAIGADDTRRDIGRERLPDIDDIGTGLDGDSQDDDWIATEIEEEERARSGFRRGFFLILVIIAILAAIYVQAPRVKELVPAAAPTVDSYVAMVDQARVWLDTTVRNLLT